MNKSNSWEVEAYYENGGTSANDWYWSSPSEELDQQLIDKGYKPQIKIAKEYNYPNNMNASEYEHSLYERFWTFISYSKGRIRPPHRAAFLKKYEQRLKDNLPKKRLEMKKELKLMQKLNPELKQITPNRGDMEEIHEIIRGAICKFPVDDIQLFINRQDRNNCSIGNEDFDEYNTKIQKEKSLNLNFLMSRSTRNKLDNIIANGKDQTKRQPLNQPDNSH